MTDLLMRRPSLAALPPLPPLAPDHSLRLAGEDDTPTLVDLLHRAFVDATWTTSRVQKELQNEPTVKQTLVVERQGNVIATASVRLLPERFPGSGYLHWVAVDPAHQGQRLGYIVSLAVLHAFADIGCADAVLETQDERLPAIKTYLRLGFVPEYTDETHQEQWKVLLSMLSSS